MFASDILWAASVGITSGDGAGGFSPSSSVLREQMAAFLHRTHNHLNK
ncbi:S-layer homology domain-containing protein [Bifidobacterium sp.]